MAGPRPYSIADIISSLQNQTDAALAASEDNAAVFVVSCLGGFGDTVDVEDALEFQPLTYNPAWGIANSNETYWLDYQTMLQALVSEQVLVSDTMSLSTSPSDGSDWGTALAGEAWWN